MLTAGTADQQASVRYEGPTCESIDNVLQSSGSLDYSWLRP